MKWTQYLCLAFLFILFPAGHLYSVTDPVKPRVPGVESPEVRAVDNGHNVIITLSGKRKIEGALEGFGQAITFTEENDGKKRLRRFNVKEILSVRILKWRGVKKGKSAWCFYPEEYRVRLKEGPSFDLSGGVSSLRRLILVREKIKRKVYTYFYDYYRDGKWVNCGKKIKSWPEQNPPRGVAVKIEFKKDKKTESLLEKLFRRRK